MADAGEARRSACLPRSLGNRERVGQLDTVVLQFLEQELDGHQLAHRCRWHRHERVLGPEHLPAVAIHQERVFGIGRNGGRGGLYHSAEEKNEADETDTPLQRSPKYANQEFFTDAERADLDRQRANMQGRERRAERGSIADVAGAYNDAFTPKKRTGLRTSRIVDPPNGRLPPPTPEAQKAAAAGVAVAGDQARRIYRRLSGPRCGILPGCTTPLSHPGGRSI